MDAALERQKRKRSHFELKIIIETRFGTGNELVTRDLDFVKHRHEE